MEAGQLHSLRETVLKETLDAAFQNMIELRIAMKPKDGSTLEKLPVIQNNLKTLLVHLRNLPLTNLSKKDKKHRPAAEKIVAEFKTLVFEQSSQRELIRSLEADWRNLKTAVERLGESAGVK